jgi:ADP-ribose pyrophosphatase
MKKIPDNAKKVFEGVIFDVYQWEQEMFDGTTATFERLDRSDTAEVIAITKEGNILLERERQPDNENAFVSLPTGRIERGEDSLVGAKRELLEETGFVTDNWSVFEQYEPATKLRWMIHVYIAKDVEKIQEPELDAGEEIEVFEVDFDRFLEMVDKRELRHVAAPLREKCIRASYHEPSKQELKQLLFGG